MGPSLDSAVLAAILEAIEILGAHWGKEARYDLPGGFGYTLSPSANTRTMPQGAACPTPSWFGTTQDFGFPTLEETPRCGHIHSS